MKLRDTQYANGPIKAAEASAAHARAARDAAQARLEEAQENVDRALAESRREIEYAKEKSSRAVRDNPMLAVAGAAGLGFLLGMAFRGRG